MGGCCSAITKKHASPPACATSAPSGPPPPEPDAVETVKEVLSETPRLPRSRLPTTRARTDLRADTKEVDLVDKPLPLPGIVLLPIDRCDARSEDTSEATSVSAKSEALSASAIPTTEKRRCAVPEAGRRAPRGQRSPAKNPRKPTVSGELASRRDRSVSVGCSSGRSSPLPAARRPEQVAVGRAKSATEAARSRAVPNAGAKRDPGERSGRRSASPASKRAAELRQSGGQRRVPLPLLPAATKAKSHSQEFLADDRGRTLCRQIESAAEGGGVDRSEGEANESLENPLVSLECFIFI